MSRLRELATAVFGGLVALAVIYSLVWAAYLLAPDPAGPLYPAPQRSHPYDHPTRR